LPSSQTIWYGVGAMRPAGQGDLDFLWDFLAIAAYGPDADAAYAEEAA
jgi:hypothetical protein